MDVQSPKATFLLSNAVKIDIKKGSVVCMAKDLFPVDSKIGVSLFV